MKPNNQPGSASTSPQAGAPRSHQPTTHQFHHPDTHIPIATNHIPTPPSTSRSPIYLFLDLTLQPQRCRRFSPVVRPSPALPRSPYLELLQWKLNLHTVLLHQACSHGSSVLNAQSACSPLQTPIGFTKGYSCSKNSGLPLNAYMLHNLAHVELNAIDLAWDTIVRFSPYSDVLGKGLFVDFAHVADDGF